MLEITIKEKELFDELKEEFINVPGKTLRLEHSLVSVSKWESKWKKPFLKPHYKFTQEELLDYIRCMTITQNVPKEVYTWLDAEELNKIEEYINDNKSATTFNNFHEHPSRQIVTSELIYYWMVAYQIPIECQCWHLSRLFSLIRICNIKNSKGKKMPTREIMDQNRRLNEQRRKASGSAG